MKQYDFVIVGAGIEGIVLSAYLSRLNKAVCLVDPTPKIGNLKNTLEVFKHDEKTVSTLRFLETELGLDFSYEKTFIEPLTFDKSFQPFVGFGEDAPPYHDWLNAYGATEQLFLQPSLSESLQKLITKHNVSVLTNSTVTRLEITENRVTEIVVNGKTNISAAHFVSTLHPLKMKRWNKDFLGTKFIQKMNRTPPWTTLSLELNHPKLNTSTGWYLLKGIKTDWFVGRFTESGSHWLAFSSTETEADAEAAGQLFKEVKKSITKAFPDLISKVTFEKLSVLSQSHGHIQFKMNQENPFQSIQNFWVCTGMATELWNPVVASISAAQELLMDFQLHGYIENTPKINGLASGPENLVSL